MAKTWLQYTWPTSITKSILLASYKMPINHAHYAYAMLFCSYAQLASYVHVGIDVNIYMMWVKVISSMSCRCKACAGCVLINSAIFRISRIRMEYTDDRKHALSSTILPLIVLYHMINYRIIGNIGGWAPKSPLQKYWQIYIYLAVR